MNDIYLQRYQPTYNELRERLIGKGYEKFVTNAEAMYQEFKKLEGYVTCEFSTTEDSLGDKLKFLNLMSYKDQAAIGRWQIFWCTTCEEHHPHHPFHCEIQRITTD